MGINQSAQWQRNALGKSVRYICVLKGQNKKNELIELTIA